MRTPFVEITERCVITQLCDGESFIEGLNGITTDDNGNLYMINDKHAIYKIPTDRFSSNLECLISTDDECTIQSVLCKNNVLYYCDSGHCIVMKYYLDNGLLEEVSGYQKIPDRTGPYGIAMDKKGDLYVTDGNCVRKINAKSQTIELVAGGSDAGMKDGPAATSLFRTPQGITISNDGTIYVADDGNFCIRKIQDGFVSTVAEDTPFAPMQIHFDHNGDLLVCNIIYGLGKIFLKTGTMVAINLPEVDSWNITCICEDNHGNLYIGGHGGVYKMEYTWKWIRYLWIGNMKEDASYCNLKKVPKEIIKEISRYLDPRILSKTKKRS